MDGDSIMETFGNWMQDVREIKIGDATVAYKIKGDTAIIISFTELNWMKPGVIRQTIDAVKKDSGLDKVKTEEGIKQHWAYAGYEGD
jgi:hypothetical protein